MVTMFVLLIYTYVINKFIPVIFGICQTYLSCTLKIKDDKKDRSINNHTICANMNNSSGF